MPDRVEVQDVTAPASQATALEVALTNVVACQPVRVEIRIPPGHAFKTGIALGYGHNAILPRAGAAYISGDDEQLFYDLTNYVPGPQWQAFLVNADTQSHTWEIRFEVDEILPNLSLAPSQPVQVPDIYEAAGQLVGV